MSIIIDSTSRSFDKSKIQKGDFIRAKYKKWSESQNGIVASVTDNEIRVLYIPAIANVTNYFNILANEVDEGLWNIEWSTDLQSIQSEGENNDT